MITTDLKIAFKSLRATKMRTALTILGVVIGVASVTMILALGEGAKQKIREQTETLGTNLLTIRSGRATRNADGSVGQYDILAALSSSTISEHDMEAVQQQPQVVSAPIMSITASVAAADKPTLVQSNAVIATTPALADVMELDLRTGEFFSSGTDRRMVVLGYDLANQLLASDRAVGQKIIIRGQEFTVIGILAPYKPRASFSNPYDFNRAVLLSFDAGKEFNHGVAHIQQINVRAVEGADTNELNRQLHQRLLDNHNGEEDFTILKPGDTMQITDGFLQLVTLFTSAVASISLIVGGIGIMNIMLVSVTERTREIGIRKTVGATNLQILRQFVTESLLMSLAGGLIGVIIAYITAFLVSTAFGFMPIITPWILLVALAMSSLVGLIFGIMPAAKAARKNPIEALRAFH